LIRVDSLHFVTFWLRATNRTEYFVPVTPLRPVVKPGQWYSRSELTDILLPEAERVVAAHRQVLFSPSKEMGRS
jgi:hypothetical protein